MSFQCSVMVTMVVICMDDIISNEREAEINILIRPFCIKSSFQLGRMVEGADVDSF